MYATNICKVLKMTQFQMEIKATILITLPSNKNRSLREVKGRNSWR